MNLQQDILDLLATKTTKEAAIFKIKIQPYFNTLAETYGELYRMKVEFMRRVKEMRSV